MHKRTIGVIAFMAAALLQAGSPASAATTSSDCTVALFNTQCKTGSVAANSSGHWVKVYVDLTYWDSVSWRVVDDGNGQVVGSGTIPSSCSSFSKKIYGLYGNYHLTVYNAEPITYGQLAGVDTAYSGSCH